MEIVDGTTNAAVQLNTSSDGYFKQTTASASNIDEQIAQAVAEVATKEVVSDDGTLRNLDDMLDVFPTVSIRCRLLIKLNYTDPEFIGVNDDEASSTDLTAVKTSSGKTLNFYSPTAKERAGDDGVAGGFLRKPLLKLATYLNSNNAKDFVLLNGDADGIDYEKLTSAFDKSVSKIVYSQFGAADILTVFDSETEGESDDETSEWEETESNTVKEQDADEEAAYIQASDLFSIDSWNNLTVSEDGRTILNYTVCLSIHSLEAYDIETKHKEANRLNRLLSALAEATQLTTLSIYYAVAFDNSMLQRPDVLDAFSTMISGELPKETNEKKKTKEVQSVNYSFVTFDSAQEICTNMEDDIYLSDEEESEIEDNEELTDNEREMLLQSAIEAKMIYPSLDDLELLIKPSEMLFVSTVCESIDSQEISTEEDFE